MKRICRDDAEALDLVDQATQNPVGRPVNVDIVNDKLAGNAAQHALRKLRKDRPDLHAEIRAGRKSPHGAMVEAGSHAQRARPGELRPQRERQSPQPQQGTTGDGPCQDEPHDN